MFEGQAFPLIEVLIEMAWILAVREPDEAVSGLNLHFDGAALVVYEQPSPQFDAIQLLIFSNFKRKASTNCLSHVVKDE